MHPLLNQVLSLLLNPVLSLLLNPVLSRLLGLLVNLRVLLFLAASFGVSIVSANVLFNWVEGKNNHDSFVTNVLNVYISFVRVNWSNFSDTNDDCYN